VSSFECNVDTWAGGAYAVGLTLDFFRRNQLRALAASEKLAEMRPASRAVAMEGTMGVSAMMKMRRGVHAGLLTSSVLLSPSSPAAEVQAPPVTGLVPDHATLSVANIESEAAWYQRVLGFKLLPHNDTNPDFLNWHLVIPGYRIDLLKIKGSVPRNPVRPVYQQQGWVHVVFHVQDVSVALKTLQALQVELDIGRDDKSVPIQLLLHDPEGNEVEIRRNVVL
jgi:catechol 2,3-dioxygenase-like lactoylglutathione lyase family enzyme